EEARPVRGIEFEGVDPFPEDDPCTQGSPSPSVDAAIDAGDAAPRIARMDGERNGRDVPAALARGSRENGLRHRGTRVDGDRQRTDRLRDSREVGREELDHAHAGGQGEGTRVHRPRSTVYA